MITPADILKARILIVDDLEANVAVLEQMLREAGYVSVTSTRDPREVCELYRRERHDLILLDLQMPGMDGFQVMEGLKEIETNGDLPVIVITAQPGHKLRALKAGARDFISKPFDLGEVLIRAHNMLEVRLLHRNETLHHLARLENSQHIAGLGDWEYDFPSHRLLWSEEVYRILGISRRDFPPAAETFYRQVHPDDLAFVHREKKAAAEGLRRADFEHRIIRPDGEVRYIHQSTGLTPDGQGQPARESGTIQDITVRKLAEDALRESEARFRKLLMLSPDATFVHVDGLITLVNQAFCQLMGAAGPGQLLGRSGLEMVHPADHDLVRERRQKSLGGQPVPPAEMKFVRLDGSTVEVEVASASFDFNGRQEVQVIARDITARKRADEELREKTALLEAQIDSSADGMIIVDTQGRKIIQNERYIELMGLPPAIAAGTDNEAARQFVLGKLRQPELVMQRVLYLYAHPHETSLDQIELNDGKTLERYSSPILGKDGKNYGRIWAFHDVTDSKAAELALRESEERFKFVARAVSDVVWDWDLAANTLWWNDGFLTTFGFVANEIEPSVEAWTSRIHPDDRSRVMGSIRHAIDTGAECWGGEYRFERKDRSHAFVQDRGYILRDAAGRGVRMVGGMRDLTEQRRMEAQYLRAQRMESIGTLAGGIAHDLNNVLTPIMMAIELLKLNLGGEPRRRKLLDSIHLNGQRGADLVRQVLSFARGGDGRRTALHLRPLIDDLEGIIGETFPRNIRIIAHTPADLWPIMGDQTQLHQVLLNLAVNARDAMPHGGSLTVAAANVTLDTAAAGPGAQAGPHVLLLVTDTGLGIPPELRDRIFEPFFTTKELGQGTGMGLSTVHTVVKGHGGFLQVESEVGRGTTFKIFLPADPNLRADQAVLASVVELPLGRGELVLVVDDEFSIRDITQQTLEAFNYRVLTASDGAGAIALYSKHAAGIAVVLTDMMMPVMDGPAAIKVLLRVNPAVRIIAASGLDSGDPVTNASVPGVKRFLLKPYTAETLLKLVREVIDLPA
jgi:PAS domain S-box-containing protein